MACAAAYLATDLFDHLDSAVQGFALAVGLSALAAFAWLWGQVRALRANLLLASVVGGAALVVAGVSRAAPDGGVGLWLLAGVLAATAAVVGRAALGAIRTVDLARIARESARASQARTYAWTGTLHHALDLYRPEPRGFTSALIRSDGRLRGYLPQGAIRALRTPGRASAGAALLLIGASALTHGAGGRGDGPAWWLWAVGATGVYLGSGWVGETWRGLRDELTMAPLFGERWGGTPARTLAWPVVAVTGGALLGGGCAVVARWDRHSGHLGDTALLVAGSVVMVLGARFLREMKLHLPLELLLPVITPLGDLSGLRVIAWQFDGFVVVVIGVALMGALPSAVGATALAFGIAMRLRLGRTAPYGLGARGPVLPPPPGVAPPARSTPCCAVPGFRRPEGRALSPPAGAACSEAAACPPVPRQRSATLPGEHIRDTSRTPRTPGGGSTTSSSPRVARYGRRSPGCER